MKHILTVILLSLLPVMAYSQTEILKPNLGIPTKIAPAYFGPNAFPVPDMLDGRTSREIKAEIYADAFLGTIVPGDFTADLFGRITIPLFSPRVNLTIWMPFIEYYSTSPEANALRRIPNEEQLTGWEPCDAYVSTDIQVLTQERNRLDFAIRACLKSASGNAFHKARNYDGPGYFFDAAFGREFKLGAALALRLALSGGFLCWQTDNGRQNDAVMYGALAALTYDNIKYEATFSGYAGWENDGDRPMTFGSELSYRLGDFSIVALYKAGLMDWPFHQVRLGIEYRFPIY